MEISPALIFAASVATVTLTAAFTDRGSPIRHLSLILLLGLAWVLLGSLSNYADSRGWLGRVIGGAGFWNAITVFDRLLLRGWDLQTYNDRTDTESRRRKQKLRGVKSRMEFGSAVSGESRGIETFWQVKNVPPFSRSDSTYLPGRASFICWHIFMAVACYYGNTWAVKKMFSVDRSHMSDSYIPFLTRISDVTAAELRARTLATSSYWLTVYTMLNFFYSLAAAFGALAKSEDVRLFSPLFGSIACAHSVRNAWGYVH